MKTGWSFGSSATWDGWNYAPITNFKGKILESLTREVLQNSLDASSSPDQPVIVNFSERTIKLSDLPDYEHLLEKMRKIEKYIGKEGITKEKNFKWREDIWRE